MCAQFTLKVKANQLSKQFGIKVPENLSEIDERILPYRKSPVIVKNGSKVVIKPMNFSLIPAWSKEPKVKFATHNARLESEDEKTGEVKYIFEKPTWKRPFLSQHCLVPITEFIEPIYTGEFKNNMVRFFEKEHELLAAAAIWDQWTDKKTGEVLESFSILTDEPSAFVKKIGHERQPVFIKESFYAEWLECEVAEGMALVKALRSNKAKPDFAVQIDRPLKGKKK